MRKAMAAKQKLRAFLEPEKVLRLQEMLQAGEISEGECREALKYMMLQGLARQQARRRGSTGWSFGHWFAKHAQGL
jgi:hypothetical protein